MRSPLVADTSGLFAAMDSSDGDHHRSAALVEAAELYVPAPTLVELDWLGESRGVPAIDLALAGIEEGSIQVVDLTARDYARVRSLCSKYADLRLDFVDAAVVAVAERLEQDTIATLDHRRFSVVRPLHATAFTLVP